MRPIDLLLPARFPAYRPGQLDLAAAIAASRARVTLLSAPTGTGKGLTYMSAARLLGARRTLVLVSSRGLQTQLLDDFRDAGMVDVRGQANYRCRGRATTCEDGEACGARRGVPARCPYVMARDRARGAEVVVTNYAYWLALRHAAPEQGIGEFDLVVCDEAHGAHDLVGDALSVEIDTRRVHALTGVDRPCDAEVGDVAAWRAYCRRVVGVVVEGGGKAWRTQAREMARVGDLRDAELENWVVEGGDARGVAWKVAPVWAHGYMEACLYRGAPRVIATSATLLPDDAHYLGLDGETASGGVSHDYLEAGSGFDARRRPFYIIPTIRVDYRMGEGGKRILLNRVDAFLGPRLALGRNGIVHSISYHYTEDVLRLSRFSGQLIGHEKGQARRGVDEHRLRPGAHGLVSPAVREGFDFPDDLCRWQVIFKVPFADSRGAVMSARLATDKQYKDHVAARDIVQMAGRGMRNEKDWCETAIFDSHFADYFARRASWPGWFKASWRREAVVPVPMEVS